MPDEKNTEVILVDENDNEVGVMEKLEAHQKGVLHRCFSIFVFNSKGEMLLQQRAKAKYHSGGLWTNACCSHPRVGEDLKQASESRLKEEMGVVSSLAEVFTYIYKADVGNGLIEYEFDHVFLGKFDGEPVINPKEADGCKWISLEELIKGLEEHPELYTEWFKIIMAQHWDEIKEVREKVLTSQ